MKTMGWVMGFVLLTTGMAFAAKTAPEYFAMATQLYNAKDYQGAYYAYEAGLTLDATSASGYQGLGDCLYALGRQSESLLAFQKSLTINPNNPKLAAFVKVFKPLDTIAVETNKGRVVVADTDLQDGTNPGSQGSTVLSHPEIKLALDKSMWVRAYAGYDFALLTDLTSGVNAWAPVLEANPNSTTATTSSAGSNGIRAGVEFGLLADPGNGFSISLENVWTQSQSYSNGATDVTAQNATFQPDLMSVSLNYYAYIPNGKGSRTYFVFSGGYYQAVVGFTGIDPALTTATGNGNESGTFTAGAFGGTFGLGETFAIGDSFGLELSGRGRIVSFNQLTSPTLTNGSTTSTGPYAIAINTSTIPGTVYVTTVANLANGFRYAVLDYSGFDADLSFNFYF